MELATTLTSQTVQNAVREVGINPNYWYPVAWANQLKPGKIMPVVIWQQDRKSGSAGMPRPTSAAPERYPLSLPDAPPILAGRWASTQIIGIRWLGQTNSSQETSCQ